MNIHYVDSKLLHVVTESDEGKKCSCIIHNEEYHLYQFSDSIQNNTIMYCGVLHSNIVCLTE